MDWSLYESQSLSWFPACVEDHTPCRMCGFSTQPTLGESAGWGRLNGPLFYSPCISQMSNGPSLNANWCPPPPNKNLWTEEQNIPALSTSVNQFNLPIFRSIGTMGLQILTPPPPRPPHYCFISSIHKIASFVLKYIYFLHWVDVNQMRVKVFKKQSYVPSLVSVR